MKGSLQLAVPPPQAADAPNKWQHCNTNHPWTIQPRQTISETHESPMNEADGRPPDVAPCPPWILQRVVPQPEGNQVLKLSPRQIPCRSPNIERHTKPQPSAHSVARCYFFFSPGGQCASIAQLILVRPARAAPQPQSMPAQLQRDHCKLLHTRG